MTDTKHYLRLAVTPLVCAALLAGCSSGPPVGEGMPPFKAKDLAGNTISRDTYRGSVTLFYFWATWCAPCAVSGPSMERLQQRFAANKQVQIVGVHYNKTAALDAYLEEHPYTFTIVPDGSAVAKAFHVGKIPSFVLMDKSGRVILNQIGFALEDEEKFIALIEKQLSR